MTNQRIKTSKFASPSFAAAALTCGTLSTTALAQAVPTVAPAAVSPERAVTAKLGLGSSFLVGLGNDAVGNDPNANTGYSLGTPLDIHYMYLSGLDWPSWNSPEGNYVTMQANAAKAHGVVPMFTLYQAAANGEANLAAFNTTAFMTKYWRGVRVMFERFATSTPRRSRTSSRTCGAMRNRRAARIRRRYR